MTNQFKKVGDIWPIFSRKFFVPLILDNFEKSMVGFHLKTKDDNLIL